MKLHTLCTSAVITFMLAVAVPAPGADAPTVDSILEKYVKALGGKAALEKATSRVIKLKMESEALPASEGEIQAKAPNKQYSRIELEGMGAVMDGFDGTTAWSKTPWENLRVKSGDELAKAKRDAVFHRELKMKTTYPDLKFKATEKIGEQTVHVLESKPTATSTEKFAFDTETGFLVRQESEFDGAQGKVKVTVLPRNYKTLEGGKYPSEMKMKYSVADQSFDFTMKIVEVKHNVPVEDAKFGKPAA